MQFSMHYISISVSVSRFQWSIAESIDCTIEETYNTWSTRRIWYIWCYMASNTAMVVFIRGWCYRSPLHIDKPFFLSFEFVHLSAYSSFFLYFVQKYINNCIFRRNFLFFFSIMRIRRISQIKTIKKSYNIHGLCIYSIYYNNNN